MQILKNIKKTIQEQSIILHQLIIIWYFSWCQLSQLCIYWCHLFQISTAHFTIKQHKCKYLFNNNIKAAVEETSERVLFPTRFCSVGPSQHFRRYMSCVCCLVRLHVTCVTGFIIYIYTRTCKYYFFLFSANSLRIFNFTRLLCVYEKYFFFTKFICSIIIK